MWLWNLLLRWEAISSKPANCCITYNAQTTNGKTTCHFLVPYKYAILMRITRCWWRMVGVQRLVKHFLIVIEAISSLVWSERRQGQAIHSLICVAINPQIRQNWYEASFNTNQINCFVSFTCLSNASSKEKLPVQCIKTTDSSTACN